MKVYWLSSGTALPPRRFGQEQVFEMAGYAKRSDAVRRIASAAFRGADVGTRCLWLELERLPTSPGADELHGRYLEGVRALAPRAARSALERSGLQPSDIDFVVFASCTGYTCPGFSVELANELGVAETKPTANLLGMGCSALVPALERAHDHLVARPGSRALVVAAEICSATYWVDDDPETAVGNALFGDGAGAVVLSSSSDDLTRVKGQAAGELLGFATLRDPRYLDDMGFAQKDGRLRVRLDRSIPDRVVPLLERMLARLELDPRGGRIALHPGGKRILDLAEERLGLSWREPLGWSREMLREVGNLSSPTAIFVLERSFERRPIQDGELGALVAMGPGLSVEGVRVRWFRAAGSM